jgi:hypothetical protein
MAAGLSLRVVLYKLTNVSEVLTASIIRMMSHHHSQTYEGASKPPKRRSVSKKLYKHPCFERESNP